MPAFSRFRFLFLLLALTAGLALPAGAQSYFESPVVAGAGNARFARMVSLDGKMFLFHQDMADRETLGSFTMGTIRILCRTVADDGTLGPVQILADRIPYSAGAAVPPVFTVSSGKGWIYLAWAPPTGQQISLMRLRPGPGGLEIREVGSITTTRALANLVIDMNPDGSGTLFASQGTGNSFSIQSSVSADGLTWTEFRAVDADLSRNVNINPVHARLGTRDYLVFQSRDFRQVEDGGTATYQLWLKESRDGGLTWSDGRLLTDFTDPDRKVRAGAAGYDNQRPFLGVDGRELVLLWERGTDRDTRHVYLMRLDRDGLPAGPAQRITENASGAFSPEWRRQGKDEIVTWFTSRGRGARAMVGRRTGGSGPFLTTVASGNLDEASYPSAALGSGGLHIAFHGIAGTSGESKVYVVNPDRTASPPILSALDFLPGSTGSRRKLRVRLDSRPDSSGIDAIALAWSRDPVPDFREAGLHDPASQVEIPDLEADGIWYIQARARDRAGNWSAPVTLRYTLDTTPPPVPAFVTPLLDDKGALASNTFDLRWSQPEGEAVTDWVYSLQYLGMQPKDFDPALWQESHADIPVTGTRPSPVLSRSNVENGWYVAAVRSRDAVGNTSEPAVLFLNADKFIPSTQITFLDLQEDGFGNRTLRITGRGFTSRGTISRIVMDRDGKAPWDYEYLLSSGNYRIPSDTLITDVALDNMETGTYRLGLFHTDRGMTFAPKLLDLEKRGVIKYGDFSLKPRPVLETQALKPWQLDPGLVAFWLVMVLLALSIPVSAVQLRGVVREAARMETTARAMLRGLPGPMSHRAGKARIMRIRILGLRMKFTVFFLLLVVAVVLLVSLPLSDYIITRQRTILAQGLQDRLQVMLESVASSAGNFLRAPDDNTVQLRQLAGQGSAMPEIGYITITGQQRGNPAQVDAVWATSDKVLLGESSSADLQGVEKRQLDGDLFLTGQSVIKDSLSPWVTDHSGAYDADVRKELGTIPDEIASFTEKVRGLLLNQDEASRRERQRIDDITGKLRDDMDRILREKAGGMQSLPVYDPGAFDASVTRYIFYRPLYFRVASEKSSEARYWRGMVRMGVSTDSIVEQIRLTREEILRNIILFALIAMGSGLAGAIILSNIIVIPILRLVRGVNRIKEIITLDVVSQDKQYGEFLSSKAMGKQSGDEIGALGNAITDMVHSLQKGAETNKDLVAGKEIQKMFIPLEKVGKGKGSVGRTRTEHSEIFGYYEGAKGVSGDYFYYQKIGPDVYASIKCDISGKGIPAALIMVEVATLFMNHFNNWEGRKAEREARRKAGEGDLVPLVRTINDLVAEREFGGKFAAFNIALFNERTGDLAFCNAGDNQVHVYRDSRRAVETSVITKSPAAGMFTSDMFPPGGGFREDRGHLDFGDILLMFTDGVEESQSLFRNPDLSLTPATEEDVARGLVPDYCTPGAGFEEFGLERIRDVVVAAQSRGSYSLKKFKAPFPDVALDFDFSGLGNSAEETVLALVSVEKVFRMIPDPRATVADRIKVDKVVDDFLARVFVQYRTHFAHLREDFQDDLYREYTHLKEESQFDDLTLLALRKL